MVAPRRTPITLRRPRRRKMRSPRRRKPSAPREKVSKRRRRKRNEFDV